MSTQSRYMSIKRTYLLLNVGILLVGLFLHLLLWDTDFLLKIDRAIQGVASWSSVTATIWVWIRVYLFGRMGVWMIMAAVFLLFVLLPIMVRYKHIRIKPTPWLAVHVSVYAFLLLKMLRVY
jgi:hypothetical protein